MAEVAPEIPKYQEYLIEIFCKESLFRKGRQPRNWRDWGLRPIKKRRDRILRVLEKSARIWRKRGKDDNTQYIEKLANHFKLLQSESVEIQELYLQVIAVSLSVEAQNHDGWFSNFLSGAFTVMDVTDDNFLNWQIIANNLNLNLVFTKHNLNWEQWVNYPPANVDFNNNSRLAQWQQLNKKLEALAGLLDEGHPVRASVQKDCMAIRKRKKEILEGRLELADSDLLRELFPTLHKTLDYLHKKIGDSVEILVPSSLRDGLQSVESTVAETSKSQLRNFRIKLWARSPLHDLFLGNTVENCLSIGEKDVYPVMRLPGVPGKRHPAGILDYLVDKGVQVVEIEEDELGKGWMVGQCYLFVFLDGSKPVLMVDSIDLHPYYQGRNKALNLKIRNALFDFLRGYARAVGIDKVVLAKDGPVLKSGKNKGKRHLIDNDMKVSDLPVVAFKKIDKLGGYWNHQPYFLESVGGSEAYVIS